MEASMPKSKTTDLTGEPRTKLGQIVASLSTKRGACAADLAALTGWQPHTVRAALTRLRQRGHAIKREDSVDGSRYRLIKNR